MDAEIRRILEELVWDNGDIIYNDDYVCCKSCQSISKAAHDSDCIVSLAKKLLGQE